MGLFNLNMKQSFSFLLFLLVAQLAIGQTAFLKIDAPKHNFGFVREGEVVKMEFVIRNTGKEPLIITDTKVECGCTTVEKPAQPIIPGGSGILKVSFDTKNKMDRQDRTVTIISNASNSPGTARFKGVVLKKKK